jgi:hypothetical protein
VGTRSLVNTQTSELSYLVGERAVALLPLNGRNYTDLALLQPGVLAYPSRDGGSVVAHGLGMSVNGQDYREVGLLMAPSLYGPAGGVTGRTAFATIVWLIAWGVLHARWKARRIAPGRVLTTTLILVAAGVLATFPPVWGLF